VGAGRDPTIYAQALAGDDQGGWISAARRVALSPEGQVSQGVARAARLLQETTTPGHQQRILVLSGGAAHRMGAAPETLKAQATTLAESGIGLTAVTVGGGLDNLSMAALAGAKGGAFGRAPSVEGLARIFGEDFEAMFVPLAYRFGLEISPASGWRLSGVFGVPEAALTWDSAGVARLTVETLFVSRKRGAIYLTFSPEGVSGMPPAPLREGSALAEVRLSYQELGGEWRVGVRRLAPEPSEQESTGLRDGRALIQWLVTMRHGLSQHQAGDVDGALNVLAGLGWGPAERARFPKEHEAWLETLALMQDR
jgi:Ca-activated chloride channel family protein